MSTLLVRLLVIVMVLLKCGMAFAQGGYPQRTDRFVNDYANVLDSADERAIRTTLVNLKAQSGIEGVILTVGSVHDYETSDNGLESFATNLFNDWGIGDRRTNKGFLVLAAVDDRQVRIELGSGYGDEFDESIQRVIEESVLPSFLHGDYGQGIHKGVNGAIGVLTEGREKPLSSKSVWLFFWPAVLVGIAFVVYVGKKVYKKIRKSRSRNDGRPKKRRKRKGVSRKRRSGSANDEWYHGGGSSSGGGSFDGGSSTSGGASGSW